MAQNQLSINTPTDSTRPIEIIGAHNMRQITLVNGEVIQTLAGNARIKQGNTFLSGDSILLNSRLGIAEVFGHVHINDADTINTFANYLRYVGPQRMAYLKNNVKLTDGRGVILTDNLEYNLQTGMATYTNGGKVLNEGTELTSESAVYYADTKDVYFKRNVHLIDSKYDITADSLLYNTAFKTAHFIAPTHIISNGNIIDTRAGSYNLDTGEALFLDQPVFKDSTRSLTGRSVAMDEKSGMVTIEGNGKMVDSINQVIVIGEQLFIDRKKNAFLATRKPVIIFYQDNDSTYIAADTLLSALQINDTTKQIALRNDTLIGGNKQSTDSVRYFLGFHHVRIYNDSLQAVSDSLFYSTEDSIFRLIKSPVFWNGKNQISGDTIHLFIANKKPDKLHVFKNSFVINNPQPGIFNQIAGIDLTATFKDGEIDTVRTIGIPAESIYYPQKEDSSYIGMNKSSGNIIDIYFANKELNKVKFVTEVKGVIFPMTQIPEDKKYLKGFQWLDHQRPKNKLELFE
ncbi:MAG: hypothetical protein KF829_05290 [Ferruginibacter sp.]|nr:hypothetical protein [Ferruginibacter sp.]